MLNFSKIDGRYPILRPLYRRGVTEAYLARDERVDGREVVIEVTSSQAPSVQAISSQANSGQTVVHHAEFETAIGVLQALDHPNVVPVLELLVDAPYICVVKAWEPGTLLDTWLRDPEGGKHASQSLRISLCRDVLEGLAAVHNAGLLHRDLRPQNIWLSDGPIRPTAQLDHFDDVLFVDGGDERTSEPVGDPLRRPPEVTRTHAYSKQSDVYAAGLTLFELLAERTPSETAEEEGDFGAWGQLEEDTVRRCVPLPYSHVVARATHRYRVERFEGGLDLLAAFDGMDLERRLREAGLD